MIDPRSDETTSEVHELEEKLSVWAASFPSAEEESLRSSLQASMDEWHEELDPFSVWGHPSGRLEVYMGPDRERAPSLVTRLLQISPEHGLRALDALPFPGLMMNAIWLGPNYVEDPERLEQLLNAAPIVFDERGVWKNHSVAALLLTDLIIDHPRRRNPRPEQGFDALLRRPDGRTIALGYLAYLVDHTMGDNTYAQVPSAREVGLQALCKVLLEQGVTVSDVYRAWQNAEATAKEKVSRGAKILVMSPEQRRKQERERRGEGARTLEGRGFSYLLGAAHLLGEQPCSQEDSATLWSWFGELLEGRDPSVSRLDPQKNEASVKRLGELLSQASRPGACYQRLYRRLELQRRRSQHRRFYRYASDDRDFQSVFLLYVGLFTAGYWSDRGAKEAPRALFFEIYAQARRLWLTAKLDFDDSRSRIVIACFAFLPGNFGEELPAVLPKVLAPIANNPEMIADAAWLLHKNGIDLPRLVTLMRDAGVDLEEAIRDLYQWSVLSDRPIEFTSNAQALAKKLGLVLHQAQTPEPDAAQKSFVNNIRWGAALVRRLTQDGLTNVTFTPFEPRNTWLLQAEAPASLRDRFGLSPLVRILVVHGQVIGRDLRHALEHPNGQEAIDPDLLIVASDAPALEDKIRHLAGPWGQRIPLAPDAGEFGPIAEALTEHLPRFDLFDRRDPVFGRALIGRTQAIDHITSRLVRAQAVAVLGLRKVGKSSLLRAVAAKLDPIGARRGMFGVGNKPAPADTPEALVISLDAQGIIDRTLSGLAEQLTIELHGRLGWPADFEPNASAPPLEDLERSLRRALESQPLPLIFIIDEYDLLFEGYDGEPGILGAHQLFALLRSLAQATSRVALALLGRDPVFVKRPHLGGFTSPLLGWVEPIWLGPLPRHEADELLVRLGKRTCLHVGPATLETAWRWTGGHPLLLREYGSALFELAHAPPSRPRTIETDVIHEEAIDLFHARDGVQTICEEVHVLLDTRFPDALVLMVALANEDHRKAQEVIARHGGPRAEMVTMLAGLGLIHDASGQVWMPEVWRTSFQKLVRSARSAGGGGLGGEE